MDSDQSHPAFKQIDHRPWPLPEGNWLLRQQWLNLAFIHWEVSLSQLRSLIPEPLEIDLYDGKAWIGIVPFDMRGVTLRYCPAFTPLSDFPEINVRTYVYYQGKPGVWFFSLDVPSRIAVWTARTFFHLPYRHAAVTVGKEENTICYRHARSCGSFSADYSPAEPLAVDSDSFEIWATERYCLYCQSKKGQLYRTEVHHPKWPLQVADITIGENGLLDGYEVGDQHPSVLFSKHLDVVAYPPQKI